MATGSFLMIMVVFLFVEISEITGIFSSAIHSFLMLPVSCNKRAQSVLWLRFF